MKKYLHHIIDEIGILQFISKRFSGNQLTPANKLQSRNEKT